jgi:hypothetical protein
MCFWFTASKIFDFIITSPLQYPALDQTCPPSSWSGLDPGRPWTWRARWVKACEALLRGWTDCQYHCPHLFSFICLWRGDDGCAGLKRVRSPPSRRDYQYHCPHVAPGLGWFPTPLLGSRGRHLGNAGRYEWAHTHTHTHDIR